MCKGHSQNNQYVRSCQIEVDSIVSNYFQDTLKNNYLVYYAPRNFVLFFVKDGNAYKEYSLRLNPSNLEVECVDILAKESIVSNLFEYKQYEKNTITFESPFYEDGYKNAFGRMVYFSAKNEVGKRVGEFYLSLFVDPVPIDIAVYEYIRSLMANFISNPCY